MTFGELAVKDKFKSDAVPGVRFRKGPNGMGECIEDPNRSQFFNDAAPVTVVGGKKSDDDKPEAESEESSESVVTGAK